MTTEAKGRHGLKATCLSFPEILSQSVANISPTLTPVVIVPLVFASAGAGTWLAYLFATIGLVLVGTNINQFAKRSATPGSLYAFVTRGLGLHIGFLAGWCLILAYAGTAMAVMAGAINYAALLLERLHVQLPAVALFTLGSFGVWLIAYKDIQLSTRVMLVLEAVSMALILILGVLLLLQRGRLVDRAQFDFGAMHVSGLKSGLILAIFSFVGYESASTLGEEARRPLINIPRSILLSVLIGGLFFMLTSYIAVAGFEGLQDSLATSTAPFNELADSAGVGFFGVLISVGAVISLFACSLASVNAGARIIFSMSRHGIFHARMGRAHDVHLTPHYAVTFCAIAMLLLPAMLLYAGVPLLDVFNDLSTIATFGFLVVYVLVSIAAPAYLARMGQLRATGIMKAVISVLFMAPAMLATVYPAPAAPADRFPYYFLGYVGLGGLWYLWLQRTAPASVRQQIQRDLEIEPAGVTGD